MHYYIVDPQKIAQSQFERVQNILYSSLSEFRIAGEFMRVTGLRSIQQLVENAFAHEAKTIVAVGGDETFASVINAIGKRDMVVGYIPLFDSEIGNIIGVKNITQAVKTVASRRIEELDLGIVNNHYFFSKINFGLTDLRGWKNLFNLATFDVKFSVNEEYQASQKVVGGIIINSRHNPNNQKKIGNPIDGLLDVLLLSDLSKWNAIKYRKQILDGFYENIPQASLVHVKKIEISQPEGLPLKIGEQIITKTPGIITIADKKLRMIVSKDRSF